MFYLHKSGEALTILLIGILVSLLSSTSIADTNRAELLKIADTKKSGEYVRKRFLEKIKKPFNATSKKKALIIGDSHAQDFFNIVLENGYLQNYQISTRYIPTRCQIYLGENRARHIKPKDKVLCSKSDNLSQAKKQITEADLIILAASWKEWTVKELPQTIDNLGLRSQQKLLIIGRKNFGKISIRHYLRLPEDKLRGLRNQVDTHQNKINGIMNKTLDKSQFVDIHGLICGTSSTSCPVFTNDLKLISFDGGHLTKDGAQYVGKILFQTPLLKNL